ncbi:hypothetical protein PGQ11_001445 [Apiospora arundinis]|uniref:Uncharacterized protein n=1 Tax=Apiospora arundinis TaxID=335852 RepID=A0ABR2JMY4_9PEZI
MSAGNRSGVAHPPWSFRHRTSLLEFPHFHVIRARTLELSS